MAMQQKQTDTVKVTLRLEQDNKTLVTPVEVTLTDEDKKDYGIGLSTETLTPLHALAKYLTEKKGATTETMKNYIMASKSQYGLYVTGISIDGKSDGSASSDALDGVNWGYAVNNTDPGVGMGSYSLKNNDAVTIYGLWGGGTWPNNVETNYSYFENSTLNTAVSVGNCCVQGAVFKITVICFYVIWPCAAAPKSIDGDCIIIF